MRRRLLLVSGIAFGVVLSGILLGNSSWGRFQIYRLLARPKVKQTCGSSAECVQRVEARVERCVRKSREPASRKGNFLCWLQATYAENACLDETCERLVEANYGTCFPIAAETADASTRKFAEAIHTCLSQESRQ